MQKEQKKKQILLRRKNQCWAWFDIDISTK